MPISLSWVEPTGEIQRLGQRWSFREDDEIGKVRSDG